MELVACEWGQSKIFDLPIIEYGATDFKTGVTLAEGDVKISKDNGAFTNIATLPTILGAWMIITLSADEMKARRIKVQVIDQTATKIFEDTGAILTTDERSWHQSLFALVESQRGSHTGVHDIIYWDPVGGNDSNSGLLFHDAKLTYNFNGANGIHSLLNNNEHQIVILIPNASGGPTTVNEYVEVDTAYTFLRGPGRDFLIEATHNESCAVKASAEGVELFGMRIRTKLTGSQDGVCSSGDFAKLQNLWVDYSRGAGIQIDNASSCLLNNFLVQDAAKGGSGHAVHILGDTSITTRNIIGAGQIFSNGNGGDTDGIRVDGSYCDHNFVTGGDSALLIHDNTGYGINEINSADHTIIVGPTVNLAHNILGDHNLTGAESVIVNHEQWAKAEDLATLQTSVDAIPTVPVTVTSGGGNPTPGYADENEPSDLIQGDVIDLPRYLIGDHSAKRLFFGCKLAPGDSFYIIGVIECTNLSYDADEDKTSYTIPFAANDSKSVSADCYKAETEIRDADGTSNPVTGDRYDFNVIGEIII